MKVKIGPYPSRLRCRIFNNYMDKKHDLLWEFDDDLRKTWFEKSLEKFQSFVQFFIYEPLNWIYFDRIKESKRKIRIDDWDVWSMDYTLSLIILPMLKKFKEGKLTIAFVDMEDVPEELRSEVKELDGGYNDDRWNYVLDEMIWTFERISSDFEDEDFKNQKKNDARVKNGLRLFGKYYQSLWD